MSVVAAAGDNKSVVVGDLIVGREVAGGDSEKVPSLSFFAQHSDENSEISAVLLLDVFGIVGAEKDCKSLHPHPRKMDLISRLRRRFSLSGLATVRRTKGRLEREREEGEGRMGCCWVFVIYIAF